jgi:Ca2+-transporting ATPase
MRRPPYPPGEGIFGRGLGLHVLAIGILMGSVSLGAGYYYWKIDDAAWQTVVFTTLTLSQMGLALAVRSERDPLYRIGLFSNRALVGSVVLTFVLQLAVIYVPPLQGVFKTVALEPADLLVVVLLSSIVFWAAELLKLIAPVGTLRRA